MIHALIPTYLTVRMWAASAGIGLAQTAALYYAPWLSTPMFVLSAAHFFWEYPVFKNPMEDMVEFSIEENTFLPVIDRLADYKKLIAEQTHYPTPVGLAPYDVSFMYLEGNIYIPARQFLFLDTQNSAVLKMLKPIIGHELAHRFYLSYSMLSQFFIKLFDILKFKPNLKFFAGFALLNILFQKYWVDRNKKEEDKRSVFQICKSMFLGALKFIVLQCVSVLLSYALSRAVETACDYASFVANGMFANSMAAYNNFCAYIYSNPTTATTEEATRIIEAYMAPGAVVTAYTPSWKEWMVSWFYTHPELYGRYAGTGEYCEHALKPE